MLLEELNIVHEILQEFMTVCYFDRAFDNNQCRKGPLENYRYEFNPYQGHNSRRT